MQDSRRGRREPLEKFKMKKKYTRVQKRLNYREIASVKYLQNRKQNKTINETKEYFITMLMQRMFAIQQRVHR